jgi:5-(aminomethyl)-3-furanmethanol phosphate kinase
VIVVKVGGSLFGHPQLAAGLRVYLESLAPSEVLLVPGGSAAADAVRELDLVHALGEEASHWLAIAAMDVMGGVLRALVPGVRVLDCLRFAREDESRPGSLPHSWDVTSDSIAARAAVVLCAEQLVLLKSADVPPGTLWEEAAARGWVDRYFPNAVAGAAFAMEVVNLRRALESLGGQKLDHPLSRFGR